MFRNEFTSIGPRSETGRSLQVISFQCLGHLPSLASPTLNAFCHIVFLQFGALDLALRPSSVKSTKLTIRIKFDVF